MNNAIGCYGKMLNFDDVDMRDQEPGCELKSSFQGASSYVCVPMGLPCTHWLKTPFQPRLLLIRWVEAISQGECRGSDGFQYLTRLSATTNPYIYSVIYAKKLVKTGNYSLICQQMIAWWPFHFSS